MRGDYGKKGLQRRGGETVQDSKIQCRSASLVKNHSLGTCFSHQFNCQKAKSAETKRSAGAKKRRFSKRKERGQGRLAALEVFRSAQRGKGGKKRRAPDHPTLKKNSPTTGRGGEGSHKKQRGGMEEGGVKERQGVRGPREHCTIRGRKKMKAQTNLGGN